jgi:transglutaminase-like putative cysteine protease
MTTTLGVPATTAPTGPAAADPERPALRRTHSWLPTVAAGVAVLLASLTLSPLLADLGWFGWSVVMVLAVSVTGGLLERTRAPLVLIPVVQTVVGLGVLLFAFVPDAPLGVLPSLDALSQLRSVLQDGLAGVETYAPPAPTDTGLVALVTLGVGVCAMTTHVLAVTLRTPVLAAAPLVALYTVPASILVDGAPWWAFVLVAVGWLAILVVDARQQVGAWGRVVSQTGNRTTGAVRVGTAAWTGPAVRLGLVAVAIALVVPPLVPGLGGAILGGRGSGSSTTEAVDPDSIALDPFVSMRRDLQESRNVEVLSYRTTSSHPAYLRSVIATTFDGEKWIPQTYSSDEEPTIGSAELTPPGIDSAVATQDEQYQLQSLRLDSPYLPLPYPVTQVNVPGDWHWDTDTAVAFSTDTTTKTTKWNVSALELNPTLAQLQAATTPQQDVRERVRQTQALRIPQRVIDLARQVTDGYSTPYEKALALQWWFRTEFTYSLDIKGDPDADQLTSFLDDRAGYCQQFAATMALMARALDIESRVAVGFTPGTEDGNGVWHVGTQDAHAWPELYFAGLGWVRFEPTPRASSDGGNVTVPGWARQDTLEQLRRQRPDDTAAAPTPSAAATADDEAATAAAQVPVADQVRHWMLLVAVVVVVMLALLPAAIRIRRRRHRLARDGPALAEGGWEELRDTVTDLGLAWSNADTPRQTEARLLRSGWADDEVSAAVRRLTSAVEQSRYAPPGAGAPSAVAADLRRVRNALEQRVDRATRWRCRLLPPSVLRRD